MSIRTAAFFAFALVAAVPAAAQTYDDGLVRFPMPAGYRVVPPTGSSKVSLLHESESKALSIGEPLPVASFGALCLQLRERTKHVGADFVFCSGVGHDGLRRYLLTSPARSVGLISAGAYQKEHVFELMTFAASVGPSFVPQVRGRP
jgi:hypothetical protein